MVNLKIPGSMEFLPNRTRIGEKSVEVMHRQGLLSSICVTKKTKVVIKYFQLKYPKMYGFITLEIGSSGNH
jgi:hypothetical protein